MNCNPIRKKRPRKSVRPAGADKNYLVTIYGEPWIATCSECDKELHARTRKIAKDRLYRHKISKCKNIYF